MKPTEAILAGVNRQISFPAMLRLFLEYPEWRVPRANPTTPPTILVTDEAMTPAVWLLSSVDAHDVATKEFQHAAIGAIWKVPVLEDVIAALDSRIVVLRIDPGSPISLNIQTDRLDVFRRIARGARVERAMAESRFADVKAFDSYFVPYFGELGQGHNIIALPTPHGQMVAAFTAEDRVDTFLSTGSDEDRQRVKFVKVDGEQLFGSAGPTIAEGVIVNYGSAHPFGFMKDACAEIAAS